MSEIGMALHVGLNRVDPDSYGGWDGELRACENDARAMLALTRKQGFDAHLLLGPAASADAVLARVAEAAERLTAGGTFVFSASCHGTRRREEGGDGDPEPDEFDEALVFYDRIVLDDETRAALQAFRPGVRVVTCMDTCHAATNTRGLRALSSGRIRAMPPAVAASPAVEAMYAAIRASDAPPAARGYRPEEVALAACRDDATAGEDDTHGYFTDALLRTWDGGRFAGSYLQLHAGVNRIVRDGQTATIGYRAGSVLPTRRPFTITRTRKGIAMPTTISPKTENSIAPTRASSQVDNWPAVLEALQELGFEITDPAPVEPQPSGDPGEGPVRMFWWGFHIELGRDTVEAVLAAEDVAGALVDQVAAAAPSPTARWISEAGRYTAESAELVRKAEEGNGVRINMSWMAAGIFVVTSVPGATEPAARTLRSLASGQRLLPGDRLVSPDGSHSLVARADGNLVLRRGGDDLWTSGIEGADAQPLFRPTHAELTRDGIVVLRSDAGLPLWAAGTISRTEAASLTLLDTGNLVVTAGSGARLWQTDPAAERVRTRADVLQQARTSDVGWGKRMESSATLYRNGTLVLDSATYNSNWFGGLRGRTLVVVSDAEGRMIWTSPIFHDPTRCSVPDVSCASNGRVTHVEHMPAAVGEFGTRIDIYHGDNPNYVDLRNVIIDIIKSFVDIASALKEAWDQLQKM